MAKRTSILLPATAARLRRLGERLRIARLRRRIAAKQVAERAGMSPMTLRSLERGGPGVTIGAYLAVLQVLGLDEDLELVASDDSLGRSLQDSQFSTHPPNPGRAGVTSRTGAIARPPAPVPRQLDETLMKSEGPTRDAGDSAENSGFLTSDELANVIDPIPSTSKRKR